MVTSVRSVPDIEQAKTSDSAPVAGSVVSLVPAGQPDAGTRLMLAVGAGGGGGGATGGGKEPGGVPGDAISVSAQPINASEAAPANISKRK